MNNRWPLECAFVQILSGVCISTNLILSAGYDDSRWPLEFVFFLILILIADYGDSRWPQKFVLVQILKRFLSVKIQCLFFSVPSAIFRPVKLSCPSFYEMSHSTIILHTDLPPSRLACFPHRCPSWGCTRLGLFPFPAQPPPFTPRCPLSPPVPRFCHSLFPQCISPSPPQLFCYCPCHPS